MSILSGRILPQRNPFTVDVPITPEEAFAAHSRNHAMAHRNDGCRSGDRFWPGSPITGRVYQPPKRNVFLLLIDKVLGL